MSELHREYIERDMPVFSPRNLLRTIKNRRNGWRSDRLSFKPLLDHGPGTLSLSPGAPEGTTDVLMAIARIELNQRNGRPPDEGIPEDILQKYFAPSSETDPNLEY